MTFKTGIVAGSFDPITNGHIWLIREALHIVDELIVAVGHNPTKQYCFTKDERERQIRCVLSNTLHSTEYGRLLVSHVSGMLVEYAQQVKADYIIRGIRNSNDFLYEQQIQAVNKKIDSSLHTLYLIPPNEYLEVSSSTVRGLVGFAGWQQVVSKYVHPIIVDDFSDKLGELCTPNK